MINFVYTWGYDYEDMLTSQGYPPPNWPPTFTHPRYHTTYYTVLGDASVNVAGGLLELSTNDFVTKRTAFSTNGSECNYYVVGGVIPTNNVGDNLMFVAAGASVNRVWPGILRTSLGYEVNGFLYDGTGGPHETYGFGCLSGQSLQADRNLSYALFVDYEHNNVAFKITDGITLLDSGFVDAFPTQEDILRNGWINQNNTQIEDFYLTGIYGSYRMTLPELSAVYLGSLGNYQDLVFVQEPESRSVALNGTTEFVTLVSPSITNGSNLVYSWYKDGVLTGQVGPNFLITSADADDYGGYTVSVTDGVSTITSETFYLLESTSGSGGFGVRVTPSETPSPGYVQVFDDSTYPGDYFLTVDIKDQETNGLSFSNRWVISAGGSFVCVLEGRAGDVYRIDLSATYNDPTEYG